jgi:hypothetical protein
MEMDPKLHYACINQLLPPIIIKTLLSLPKMSLRGYKAQKVYTTSQSNMSEPKI